MKNILSGVLANLSFNLRPTVQGEPLLILMSLRASHPRSGLEEALGLKFEDEKGEHFFRSSLIQTLFYGVCSAWVLWARKRPAASKDRFDWNATARLLEVPVINKLFHEMADPGQLEELNLSEVAERAPKGGR
jgi:hypothetical protein